MTFDACLRPTGRLFGLTYRSELPLPGLPAAGGPDEAPDVVVRLGRCPEGAPVVPSGARCFACTDEAVRVRLPVGAEVWIGGGREVIVDAPPAAYDAVRLFLVNIGLALVVLQRRRLVLHGAAVVIDGRAVAVVGTSIVGKSVLALAMAHRGHTVLADEVCALAHTDDGPAVAPGPPYVQAWPDVLAHLGAPGAPPRPVRPGVDKAYVPLTHPPAGPVPLAHVMVLEQALVPQPVVAPLDRSETVTALLNHTHQPMYLQGMGLLGFHLEACAQVARHVRGRRLTRPRARDFEALEALCRTLEQEVAA